MLFNQITFFPAESVCDITSISQRNVLKMPLMLVFVPHSSCNEKLLFSLSDSICSCCSLTSLFLPLQTETRWILIPTTEKIIRHEDVVRTRMLNSGGGVEVGVAVFICFIPPFWHVAPPVNVNILLIGLFMETRLKWQEIKGSRKETNSTPAAG